MTIGRPAHQAPADEPDMVEVWSAACAREHLRATGEDCGGCRWFKRCQKDGDKLVSYLRNLRTRGRAKRKRTRAG